MARSKGKSTSRGESEPAAAPRKRARLEKVKDKAAYFKDYAKNAAARGLGDTASRVKGLVDRDNIEQRVNKIRSKGAQRLSIMVIPHGERRVISFQLSLAMIIFSIFVCASLFGLSIAGIMSVGSDDGEHEQLSKLGKRNLAEMTNFREGREQLEEIEKKIHENHQRLLKVVEANVDEAAEYKVEDVLEDLAKASILAEEKAGKVRYINEIVEFRILREKLARELMALRTLSDFVGERSGISRGTPYSWPVYGRVSSGFGVRTSPTASGYEHHPGIDIAAGYGTAIIAPADGVVVSLSWSRANYGYGTHLIIQHKYGFRTLYGHCNQLFVQNGERVRKGQKIATVGMTGRTTGAHLHYEVLYTNDQVKKDPAEYLPGL